MTGSATRAGVAASRRAVSAVEEAGGSASAFFVEKGSLARFWGAIIAAGQVLYDYLQPFQWFIVRSSASHPLPERPDQPPRIVWISPDDPDFERFRYKII